MIHRLIVVVLFLCASAIAAAQPTYHIKLDRPHTAGEHFSMSTFYIFHQSTQITSKGSVLQKSDSDFTAQVEVDAEIIDPTIPTMTVTVRRCEMKRPDGTVIPVIAPGTMCMFNPESNGKRITPRDSSVAQESLQLLDDAFPGTTRNISDSVIGTVAAQRVGGTWKIDAKRIADGLNAASSMNVNAKDVAGKATLASVHTDVSEPQMTVEANVALKNMMFSKVEGVRVKSSHANIQLSGTLPLDESKGILRTGMTLIVVIDAGSIPTKGTPNMEISMEFMRSASTAFTYGN